MNRLDMEIVNKLQTLGSFTYNLLCNKLKIIFDPKILN